MRWGRGEDEILTPGGKLPPPGTDFIMEYILSPEFVESAER